MHVQNNTEEQIVEMREFIGQITNDIVQNLKQSSGAVQKIQEILEVNYTNLLNLFIFLGSCYYDTILLKHSFNQSYLNYDNLYLQ